MSTWAQSQSIMLAAQGRVNVLVVPLLLLILLYNNISTGFSVIDAAAGYYYEVSSESSASWGSMTSDLDMAAALTMPPIRHNESNSVNKPKHVLLPYNESPPFTSEDQKWYKWRKNGCNYKIASKHKEITLRVSSPKFVQTLYDQFAQGPAVNATGTNKAAICTMQKNEGWILRDWINYHLAIGFHDIYLFNDGKQDFHIPSTPNVHVFTVEKWEREEYIHTQSVIYHACVEIIRRREPTYKTTWVTFFDVDEYLVLKGSPQPKQVVGFLEEHCPERTCGALRINWLWFGTSNQTYYSEEPLPQRFTYRDHRPDNTVKSIVRVEHFFCATNAHFVHFRTSDPLKNPSKPPFSYDMMGRVSFGPFTVTPNDDYAVFHHYTMSMEEWFVRRCKRGDVNFRSGNAINKKCTGKYPEAGSVHDTSAADFYQTMVLDRLAKENETIFIPPFETPKWKHYPESVFGVKEIMPFSEMY